MDGIDQILLLYFGTNFLATLIWWIIPAAFYYNRSKYNLPAKGIVWPTNIDFIKTLFDHDGGLMIVLFSILGVITMTPVLCGTILCIGVCKLFKVMSFSKNEKKEIEVQIALGTIEKNK